MKIWYADQYLVTGRDVDDIAPLDAIQFGGEQAVELAEFLRGATVLPIPRGNRSHTLSLSTIRQCRSYEEAMAMAVAPLQDVTKSGELRIELSDGTRLTTQTAAVRSCKPTRVGLSLTLAWEFVMGAWTIEQSDIDSSTVIDCGSYLAAADGALVCGWYGDNSAYTQLIDGGSY